MKTDKMGMKITTFGSYLSSALLLGGMLGGCGSEDLTVYKVPKTPSSAQSKAEMSSTASSESHSHSHGGHVHRPYDFDLPQGWTEKQAGGMRLASFDVKVGEVTLDSSIVQLGPAAGDLFSNVNRWRGQVGLANADLTAIEGDAKKLKSGLGEVKYWPLINKDRPDGGILAAMIHLPGAVLFIKVSGDPSAVEKAEPQFVELCSSLRPHSH
jgi:hypothetical protein